MLRFLNYSFTQPLPLLTYQPSILPGVYALLRINTDWEPSPFEPIFFGRSAGFHEHGLDLQHPMVRRWLACGGSVEQLWASVTQPIFIEADRVAAEAMLIRRYGPTLNTQMPSLARSLGGHP